ncbi:MAG: hypothetical protein V3U52_08635 [Thermoplasmata archaeon]
MKTESMVKDVGSQSSLTLLHPTIDAVTALKDVEITRSGIDELRV